jgi:hypothetical protein
MSLHAEMAKELARRRKYKFRKVRNDFDTWELTSPSGVRLMTWIGYFEQGWRQARRVIKSREVAKSRATGWGFEE